MNRLGGDGRGAGRREFIELAADMRPAKGELNAVPSRERAVAGVAVHLHEHGDGARGLTSGKGQRQQGDDHAGDGERGRAGLAAGDADPQHDEHAGHAEGDEWRKGLEIKCAQR